MPKKQHQVNTRSIKLQSNYNQTNILNNTLNTQRLENQVRGVPLAHGKRVKVYIDLPIKFLENIICNLKTRIKISCKLLDVN